jgi:peptidoglycan hydrolase CwlO-like protein
VSVNPPQGKIMKKRIIASLSAVLVTTIALGYEIHHPNLRDAYGAAANAIHHIQEAQANNKGVEFGGHAEKALDALQHAQQELIEADKWNDAHHK